MRSFFFWLALAATLGAILGTLLRPGFPEIAITFVVINGFYYGVRSLRRGPQQAPSA